MLELPDDLGAQVEAALREDIGSGDVTAALVPADQRVRGRVICREAAVLCGTAWVDEIFRRLDASIRITWHVRDGDRVAPDTCIFEIEGPARPILTGERTALNFLQTLSATATAARRFVDAVAGTGCTILDTRKTLPGLRSAQKYAVRCGGAQNHRRGLYDLVLIKENHIAAVGGIRIAVERARASAPHTSRVEIEVRNLEELDEALAAGADIIMLDNFDDASVERATQRARGKALIEVSGGLTLERIPRLAALGVDVMSVGALTHSAPAADISLLLRRLEGGPPPRAPG